MKNLLSSDSGIKICKQIYIDSFCVKYIGATFCCTEVFIKYDLWGNQVSIILGDD